MTSRERVRAALCRQQTDRCPNGLGGCETAGLHILAYQKARKLLRLPERPVKVNTFMYNAVFERDALSAMHGDILLIESPNLSPSSIRKDRGWRAERMFGTWVLLPDADELVIEADNCMYLARDGVRYAKCPAGGLYFDSIAQDPLFGEVPMPKPSQLSYRRLTNDEKLRELEETAKRYFEETSFSLCCGESICDLQLMPGGMLNWYDALLGDLGLAGEFLERATDAAIADLEVLSQALGDRCDMLPIAHDLGDRRGVTMGPELFRRAYLPHYRRLFAAWHERTGMRILMHSCGSIADILEDLIDCGLDVINPVQISCENMAPAELKARFGNRVIFYGGAYDAVKMSAAAGFEEVYHEVTNNIRILGKGGGFIFAGVHNLPGDIPDEHLEAMLQAYERLCVNA